MGGKTEFNFKSLSRLLSIYAMAWLVAAAILPLQSAGAQTASGSDVPNSISSAPNDSEIDAAAQRLKASLSPELLQNFGLFLYIDKAEHGPLAQRMYVFEKTGDGDLALLYDWPVSTGRERIERDAHGRVQYSGTPLGFFELDPKRFFVDHDSSQYDEPMPYAMFFDWKPGGHKTGLAIHGTTDENLDVLGSPASAGCVRLSVDNAHTLFDLVANEFRGPSPKLAYLDGQTGVSSEGLLVHAPDGSLQRTDGYSVLVLIDDFGGEERISAL